MSLLGLVKLCFQDENWQLEYSFFLLILQRDVSCSAYGNKGNPFLDLLIK